MNRTRLIHMIHMIDSVHTFNRKLEYEYIYTMLDECAGFSFTVRARLVLLVFIHPNHNFEIDIIDQPWTGSTMLSSDAAIISEEEEGVIYTRDSEEFEILYDLIHTMYEIHQM